MQSSPRIEKLAPELDKIISTSEPIQHLRYGRMHSIHRSTVRWRPRTQGCKETAVAEGWRMGRRGVGYNKSGGTTPRTPEKSYSPLPRSASVARDSRIRAAKPRLSAMASAV